MDGGGPPIQLEKLKEVRESFIKANQKRLKMTTDLMRANQINFLDLLPLLFHVNHPSLPGFSGHEVPSGVSAYMPSGADVTLARRLWRNFELQKQTNWVYDIHSLFLMGSAGSIAYNKKSDFDFWLCYRSDMEPAQIESLKLKVEGIEQWAETLGLEVHFFLMDAEKFRGGEQIELSAESSGSAQHYLLLDEFYRTSIWIAGRQPLWWFIPPDRENEYSELKQFISSNTFLGDGDFIDLGGISNIPSEEYVGAGLWQLNKGIDSPYKSVLKITLMEYYASEFPNTKLLCTKYKENIYNGQLDMSDLDPYLLLLRTLEDYLDGKDETLRLELTRRSFYVKLGLPLSQKVRASNWRHKAIASLVAEWNWDEEVVQLLDGRKNWSIFEVMNERKMLIEHLTKSYLFLSQFTRDRGTSLSIDDKDLNILGRKLYSIFERKSSKVEIVNRGITSRVFEEKVTYILAQDKNKNDLWLLYRGKVSARQIQDFTPIKASNSLAEVLAWGYFNQVTDAGSSKLVYSGGADIKPQDIDIMFSQIQMMWPDPNALRAEGEAYTHRPRMLKSLVFINPGKTPRAALKGKDKTVISGKADVFHAGHINESLIVQTDHIYVTNWAEVYVESHFGMRGLFEWMTAYLNWGFVAQSSQDNKHELQTPSVLCMNGLYGSLISSRVMKLCNEMYDVFFGGKKHDYIRYIVEATNHYFMFSKTPTEIRLTEFNDSKELFKAFEKPQLHFNPLLLDAQTLKNNIYREILARNTQDKVQLFYTKGDKFASIFILDEQGALFTQRIYEDTLKRVLHEYYILFKKNLSRQRFPDKDSNEQERLFTKHEDELYEYYRITAEKKVYTIVKQDLLSLRRPQGGVEVSVIGQVEDGKKVFNFYVDHKEISSKKYGNEVFDKVAKTIKKKLGDQPLRTINILDLQIDPRLLGVKKESQVRTIHVLQYKRVLEEKINKRLLGGE
ncbi:MAG: class I adenylate cyclase [Gammaproteobacteria bacterium]|nr:class I adenylate cyclase [Gammaproteobacteria bacterium]